mmetsp:Transcript_8354/g.20522  ORF Transcript_8354/g.20522 Transcript_8354/m.20522 type:complete len:151 (+) Transcript_8354:380-832(+)
MNFQPQTDGDEEELGESIYKSRRTAKSIAEGKKATTEFKHTQRRKSLCLVIINLTSQEHGIAGTSAQTRMDAPLMMHHRAKRKNPPAVEDSRGTISIKRTHRVRSVANKGNTACYHEGCTNNKAEKGVCAGNTGKYTKESVQNAAVWMHK